MSPALQGNLVYMVTGGAFGPMPGGSGQIGPGPSLHHVDRVAEEHCVLGLRHPGACQGDAPRPGGVSCARISAGICLDCTGAQLCVCVCDDGQELAALLPAPLACLLAVLSQGRDQEPEARADPKEGPTCSGWGLCHVLRCCVNCPSRKSLPRESWTAVNEPYILTSCNLTACCNPAALIKTAAALYG